MKEEIIKVLEKSVIEGAFPGAVVGIINNNERQYIPIGRFEYDNSSPLVKDETVYDVASITKAIPIALMALKFIEMGKLSLDDKIIKYIPEISIEDREKGLIRHLLTYTYVLKKNTDSNFSYENSTAEDIISFLYSRDYEFLPGTKYKYSNAPLNLLGIVLERISGKKLYDLAKEVILDPLEMENSTFSPRDKKNIPPTEIVSWRGKIQGEVHDETASILQKAGYNPGCAGLFSNAPDILNVVELLLDGGVFRGKKIFDSGTINLMKSNSLNSIGESAGIGWELNQSIFMGKANGHVIGKTGFTGTCVVIDIDNKKGFVILSNSTFPKRPETAEVRQKIRREISDIVLN